jgi:hypothetical protein
MEEALPQKIYMSEKSAVRKPNCIYHERLVLPLTLQIHENYNEFQESPHTAFRKHLN